MRCLTSSGPLPKREGNNLGREGRGGEGEGRREGEGGVRELQSELIAINLMENPNYSLDLPFFAISTFPPYSKNRYIFLSV